MPNIIINRQRSVDVTLPTIIQPDRVNFGTFLKNTFLHKPLPAEPQTISTSSFVYSDLMNQTDLTAGLPITEDEADSSGTGRRNIEVEVHVKCTIKDSRKNRIIARVFAVGVSALTAISTALGLYLKFTK